MHPAILLIALVAFTIVLTAVLPRFAPALHLRETARAFPAQRKHWLSRPDDEDDRRELFTPGRRYRVKGDVKQRRARFEDGEVLTFTRADYSRFDHAYIYNFRHNDGRTGDWWLSDSKPSESSQHYFEPLC